ncbi:hypothetical protein EDB85DRAFT_605194 [Lactarius pseudohatsudake]|nr:hypothetical protein EDB85DRAFT_605194 [Lactarius pseudohatsudake]
MDGVYCASGLNNQTLAEVGADADLDAQFALGISFPTPGTFYSTGGRAPFIKDVSASNTTNAPYGDVTAHSQHRRRFLNTGCTSSDLTSSCGEDPFWPVPFLRPFAHTVPIDYAHRVRRGFAQLGSRLSLPAHI